MKEGGQKDYMKVYYAENKWRWSQYGKKWIGENRLLWNDYQRQKSKIRYWSKKLLLQPDNEIIKQKLKKFTDELQQQLLLRKNPQ